MRVGCLQWGRMLVLGAILVVHTAAHSAALAADGQIVKATGEQIVEVAADHWCPYNCDPESDRPGFLVEIGREAFALSGYELRYSLLSWSRALRESERGSIDAAIGATHANAPRHHFGAEMIGRDETVIFVRRSERFAYRGPTSLLGRRIGVIKDYSYDNNGPLDAYIAANREHPSRIITVSTDNNLDLLLRMLIAGRIDGFLENRFVGQYTATEHGVQGNLAFVSTGAIDHVSFAFTPNKRGEALSLIFDKGVRKLRASGRYLSILDRYGLSFGDGQEEDLENQSDGQDGG